MKVKKKDLAKITHERLNQKVKSLQKTEDDKSFVIQIVAAVGLVIQIFAVYLYFEWAEQNAKSFRSHKNTGLTLFIAVVGMVIQFVCAFIQISKVKNGGIRTLLTICALFLPFGAFIITLVNPHKNK